MIKLIALLLTIITANANIFPFLLPDEGSRFNHHLQTHLKNAQKEIVIITHSMNYPTLSKSIIRSLSTRGHLTLIVSKPSGDPLRLIAYEGVNLYTYPSRTLTDTLILIDNTQVCHLSGPLSEKHLTNAASSVWCSDDPSLILRMQKHVNVLLRRSAPYLE